MLANLARPGETVAVLNAGKFGERWHGIARAYGFQVAELHPSLGDRPSPRPTSRPVSRRRGKSGRPSSSCHLQRDLHGNPARPGRASPQAARERGKLGDRRRGHRSLGVHPMHFDSLGPGRRGDCGSQKGLMAPARPGLRDPERGRPGSASKSVPGTPPLLPGSGQGPGLHQQELDPLHPGHPAGPGPGGIDPADRDRGARRGPRPACTARPGGPGRGAHPRAGILLGAAIQWTHRGAGSRRPRRARGGDPASRGARDADRRRPGSR